jgi:hypothetical protein
MATTTTTIVTKTQLPRTRSRPSNSRRRQATHPADGATDADTTDEFLDKGADPLLRRARDSPVAWLRKESVPRSECDSAAPGD